MHVLAPAKVNLTLAIKAKRADGYHDLETVMQKIDLCDRLSLKKVRAGIKLQCWGDNSSLPEGESNIVHKAAAAFFEQSGVTGGVEIVLEKKIPIAAGLGGGSSDAAAVLRCLNQLYKGALPEDVLFDIAVKLGADVPFFVADQGAAFACGIGELLHPVSSLTNCWLLLVNPGFLVSTKWVYDNFALTSSLNPYTLGSDFGNFFWSGCLEKMQPMLKKHGVTVFYNDLENVTVKKFPQLDEIKVDMKIDGSVFAMMSGSGPTVFGVFTDQKKAEASCQNFKGRYSEVYLCRPLGHNNCYS